MHNPYLQNLHRATLTTAFCGFLALASLPTYGMLALLYGTAMLVLSGPMERLAAHTRWYNPVMTFLSLFIVCALPFAIISFGIVMTITLLVVYIQSYLLLTRKRIRDYTYILLMSFFLVLIPCAGDPEPLIGLALILFLLSATWTFTAWNIARGVVASGIVRIHSLQKPHEESVRAPEERLSRAWYRAQYLSVAALFAAAIVVGTFFFAVVPRVEAGLLGTNVAAGTTTGITSRVDLRNSGTVLQDFTAVIRVTFPDTPTGQIDAPESLYWRVTTLAQYRSGQWFRRPSNTKEESLGLLAQFFGSTRGNPRLLERDAQQKGKIVHQVIYLDRPTRDGLPCLDLVQRVQLAPEVARGRLYWERGADFTVQCALPERQPLLYEVWSEVWTPTPQELRACVCDYSQMDPVEFQLYTEHDLRPDTINLIQRLTAQQSTTYDKILRLQQWLSSSEFFYTLNLPELDPQRPVDDFLLRAKRGHCEIFASALCLMIRALGVPARVVVGYRGAEWNGLDGAYVVRANMAHLWVEAYFPEIGWVRFDPSPRGEETHTLTTNIARLISYYQLRARMFWFQNIIGFNSRVQQRFARDSVLAAARAIRAYVPFFGVKDPNRTPSGSLLVMPTSATLSVGAIVLCLVLGSAVYYKLHRRRNAPTSALTRFQNRAVWFYKILRRRLLKLGMPPDRITSEEIEQWAQQASIEQKEEIVRLLRLYDTVRFGGASLSWAEWWREVRRMQDLRRSPTPTGLATE